MNYTFNLDDWLPRIPLQERLGRYYAEVVSSPSHLCQNEHLRRELHDEYDWGPAVPVDIFVMADGEPPDRHVTKIGGLPYRDAAMPWPNQRDGTPLVFLGQFNFCESKDLTGDLPGDILLVFADHANHPETFHFEWQHIGLGTLVESDSIPKPRRKYTPTPSDLELQRRRLASSKGGLPGMEMLDNIAGSLEQETEFIAPCYGHRCRVKSYPQARRVDSSNYDVFCKGKMVSSAYRLPRYQGTQIGNSPYFSQEYDHERVVGRLICSLSSVQPACDYPFPWVNRETPISYQQMRQHANYLMIGDLNYVHISIDDAGNTHGF